MKKYLLLTFLVVGNSMLFAQTGPGGIGSNSNNMIWLDASSLSLSNGAQVGSWIDQSGNNNSAYSSSSNRPVFQTNQLNGFPTLRFDGTNDFIRVNNASGINNNEITWFIVGNFNNFSSSQMMLHFSHTGSSYQKNLRYTLYYQNNNLVFSSMLRNNGGGPASKFSRTTNTQIMSTVLDLTTMRSFTNGNQTGTFTTPDLISPVNANQYVTIGRRAPFNDMYLNGNIAEVIVYNYDLNNTERTIVENYLASKYSLTITNDKYAYEGSGHYFGVTGIGQEGGNAVTGSIGGSAITITNMSSMDDDDYLLWGNDNGGLTENFVDVPAEMLDVRGTRLDQVWRFDETNDIGTYSFNIDMTGITLGLDPERYVLLIDDDGDFTNGGTTIDSVNFSYNTITEVATWDLQDFADGAYVTVGWMPKKIYSITTGPWEDMNTWNCTCVPTLSVNAVVRNTHVVTVGASSAINSLKVEAGGTLNFSGNNDLALKGDLSVLGAIDVTNGSLTFNGTFNQDIDLITAEIDNLTVDNSGGVTMSSGTVNLNKVLTVTSGNFELGNDLITLVSNASFTGRIAFSTGTFSGNMIIQRYIGSRSDGYSDMSSPVTSATFAGWADDFEMSFTAYVPNWTTPSAWSYSESLYDFVAIETSSTSITPGIGYEVYLDNDGLENTGFSATVLELSGTPNRGAVSVPVTIDNDGWNLIGNPYASFIDFTTFRTNCGLNISNYFLYYDETIEDYAVGNPGNKLAQSQGFWVEALEAGSLNFRENNKATNTNSNFRNPIEGMFSLRVSSNETKYTSNTYIKFDDFAGQNYEANHDLSFLKVPAPKAPSLYTHSIDGKNLRINELKPESNIVIAVDFVPGFDGTYTISSINQELLDEYGYDQVILEDKNLGIFYDLLNDNYVFEAKLMDKENRFNLHLKSSENTDFENGSDINFVNSINGVFVNFNYENNKKAIIDVFNVAGQEITETISAYTDSKTIGLQIPKNYQGMYIIRVIIDEKVITQRFYKN